MDYGSHAGKFMTMDTYLLIKYFKCTASREEEAEVRRWLADDPDGSHARQYREAHLIFSGMVVHGDGTDAPARTRRQVPLRKIFYSVAVAASVAIVAAVSFSWSRYETLERLASRTETVKVPAGRSMEMTLEDGTEIWLNAGTEIEYPSVFSRKARTVKLISGEVMFDVSRDEDRPFVVETFASTISVLGTKFNVAVDEENNDFSAALLRGSIKVSSKLSEDEEFILEPNDMVKMTGNHLYVGKIEDTGSVGCWTRGLIDVAGVPFDELMRKLELVYDVEIIIDREDLPEVRYTWGKIRISEGLDHALSVLAKASDFTWERDMETGIVLIR